MNVKYMSFIFLLACRHCKPCRAAWVSFVTDLTVDWETSLSWLTPGDSLRKLELHPFGVWLALILNQINFRHHFASFSNLTVESIDLTTFWKSPFQFQHTKNITSSVKYTINALRQGHILPSFTSQSGSFSNIQKRTVNNISTQTCHLYKIREVSNFTAQKNNYSKV